MSVSSDSHGHVTVHCADLDASLASSTATSWG